ncbi:MAG: hypothetical protein HY820_10720 [Acidobacteria bacterium]|nr:hypothetical protein [Acidobacteriota bacterium]
MRCTLPPEDFRRLAKWLRELEQSRWDEQMDRDSIRGKLDFLFQEAEDEVARGLTRKWPAAE